MREIKKELCFFCGNEVENPSATRCELCGELEWRMEQMSPELVDKIYNYVKQESYEVKDAK